MPTQKRNFLTRYGNIVLAQRARLTRFFLANTGNLSIKLGTLWALDGILDPRAAYAIGHLVVFLTSYASHCKFTFEENYTVKNFIMFAKAVVLIKLLDYGSFYLLVDYFEDSFLLALAITMVIFIIRYVLLSWAFLHKK